MDRLKCLRAKAATFQKGSENIYSNFAEEMQEVKDAEEVNSIVCGT
jgi:hypothetical protein